VLGHPARLPGPMSSGLPAGPDGAIEAPPSRIEPTQPQLVADSRSRLPYEASHSVNQLNHGEALWDPALQEQVAALLATVRTRRSPTATPAVLSTPIQSVHTPAAEMLPAAVHNTVAWSPLAGGPGITAAQVAVGFSPS
jgi:hypothetical protein